MDLCKDLPPLPNQNGVNIGLFGNTGVGKSSLINTCLGDKICKVGFSQTTLEATPHRIPNTIYTYWDLPGQTDKISYLNTTYIGLLKSLSFIGIVVVRTSHEISRIIELIEYLGLPYSLIVNKIDLIETQCEDDGMDFKEEMDKFKSQFEGEVKKDNFHPRCIYYISNRNKNKYDFPKLMNEITNFMIHIANMEKNSGKQALTPIPTIIEEKQVLPSDILYIDVTGARLHERNARYYLE